MLQKWEYKVFASHLDPAELVVILDECGRDGWELVALAAVADYLPAQVVEQGRASAVKTTEADKEVVQMEAFRYIFKRPLAAV